MHSLFRHLHGSANQPRLEAAPPTTGNLIRWARRYDLVVQIMALGQAGTLRRMTIDQAQVKPGDHILDVGCGTGDLTLLAKKAVGPAGQVVGIDPALEMIDVARGKASRAHSDADFRVGLIEKLPFPAASFDKVLSSLMMHHLPDDLKRQGLSEIRRVLKPDGRLVIVDFQGLLEAQNVVALVKEAGFTQIETRTMWWKRLGVICAA